MDDAWLDSAEFDRAPGDVLPVIVLAGQFLVRTERLIVALSHLSVYANGCALQVLGCARGPGVVFRDFDRLVFTVRFAAEQATLYDKTAPQWLPDGSPALQLTQLGTETGWSDQRADCRLQLWLSPLPPPVPGTLSVVSPEPGTRRASCPLDGRAIAAAATGAQPFWP